MSANHCSNMCNSLFQLFCHPGLNPSSATLFTIGFRTTVATSLQKAAPLVRSNRLKPCCNLGLNGVSTRGSNRAAPSFQTLLQTKKTPRFYSRCLQTWVGTVFRTRWNGQGKITTVCFSPHRCNRQRGCIVSSKICWFL